MIWAKITQNLKFKTQNYISKVKTFLVLGCVFAFLALNFDLAYAFSKAPLPKPLEPQDSFTFVAFGDNQGNDTIFLDLIDKVNQEEDLAFAVHLGDMVINGTPKEFDHYLKLISKLKLKTYAVPGNHDVVVGNRVFKKYFGPLYYSFDHKNAHFVVLNNSFKPSFDAKQFAWLKQDLAQADKEHIFVFMHRPTFDPTEIYKNYMMSGRKVTEELMRVCEKYKVDYVIAGHLHGYARTKRKGVVYLISGGAGGPLYLPKDFGGFHHYVRIEVDGSKIKDKVIKLYE